LKKTTLFLLAILLFSFIQSGVCQDIKGAAGSGIDGDKYSKLWRQVDSLEKKGLPRSALKTVEEIYVWAKKDNEPVNFVKAVIHKLKYSSKIKEGSKGYGIEQVMVEADSAPFPVKQILHSMLADLYFQYYQDNRNEINDRSTTENYNPRDIATWDLKRFVKQTIDQHKAALDNADGLKKINIYVYDDILIGGRGRIGFRPTLYDFLAHRAIDFFLSTEPDITHPGEKFILDDEKYFLPADEFVKIKIESADSLSFKFYAIRLLQDLISFHLNDINPIPLIDVDLKRLNFVNQQSDILKENIYLKALGTLEQKYITIPLSAQVSYQIADVYHENSKKYNPRISEDHKWEAKKALEICEKAISRFPEFNESEKCKYLLNLIKYKKFHLTMEEVSIPDKPSKTLVSYTNVKQLYFHVIKTSITEWNQVKKEMKHYNSKKEYKDRRNETEMIIDFYRKKPAIHAYTVNLPDDGDYQEHSAEAMIPSLPKGEYVIMAINARDSTYHNQTVGYSFISVTDISYIHRSLNNNDMEFYVLHRQTGKPLEGATAKVICKKYDGKTGKYIQMESGAFKADKNGYFLVKATKEHRNFSIELNYKDDTYSSDLDQSKNNFHQYANNEKIASAQVKTIFFTDRAIYRPGQIIYFKGIMVENDGAKKNTILTNRRSHVELRDINWQKVAHLDLITNEFGSFSGSFIIPSSGLTGQMRIQDSTGSVYFSVEDYKRPKFEVTIDKAKGAFKLNDSVKVKGNAKAYSGANIDHMPVKFIVKRSANFPSWWYYRKGYYPEASPTVVSYGVIYTNEKGEFTVPFKAIPDLSVPAESEPIFTYTISIDVTDMNGETRSNSSEIRIGYNALKASVIIPELLERNKEHSFEIRTTNLDGQFEGAKGTVVIYKLKNPEKAFRERYWEKPDKFTMSKEEFSAYFPLDEYSDENNYHQWDKEEKVLEQTFDTNKDKNLVLTNQESWKQGKYLIQVTTADKYGNPVKEIKYFTLFSPDENSLPFPKVDWFTLLTEVCEPGEKASMLGGSSMDSISILYEVEQGGNLLSKKMLTLNASQKLLEENILEEHRGNIGIHYTFIKNNRIYKHDGVIDVPCTNKDLDISFETFRDKLHTGEKEQWKIIIKGKKGDKVAAEMVATLYDASLDAFKSHEWSFQIHNIFAPTLRWNSNAGFDKKNAGHYLMTWNQPEPRLWYPSYYKLNWFGFGYYEVPVVWDLNPVYYDESQNRFSNVDDLNPLRRTAFAKPKIRTPRYRHEEDGDPTRSSPGKRNTLTGLAYNEEGEGFISGDIVKAQISGDNVYLADIYNEVKKQELMAVQSRTNFNETAFFFPNLQTDSNGALIINFTIPEALTKWKMLGFAHTKDLRYGFTQKELITQKDLMVVPNAPRFFREGDTISFSSKINNLSEKDLSGSCQLMLFDAVSMKPIDQMMGNNKPVQNFSSKAGQSTGLFWNIQVPQNIQAITYRVVAKSGNFSDGEEMTVPVLTNRMLVTESMPISVRSKQTKTFTLDKLVNNTSSTLTNHKLTLEFTSKPAWYAILALPYLMEYPYECAEQVFSRFYANSIASHIANSDPKIKSVFDSWKNTSPDALLSNLEKNQEIKSILLEETPWVREAKGETERKRRIALLFDLDKMNRELETSLGQLRKMQKYTGAWPWFEGMPEDRYISQYILTGMGHLDHLGIKKIKDNWKVRDMIHAALRYSDKEIKKNYDELKLLAARKKIKMSDNHLNEIHIQYLYARSFFKEVTIDKVNSEAVNYFKGQAKKYWLSNGKYMQGMIALALSRDGEKSVTAAIVKSLREFAINDEEMGMYWKNENGYYWHQAPIETQALMIEVFDEVAKDRKAVDELKVWLLKQKQPQDWKTTRATAEACYALLSHGTKWIAGDSLTEIEVGEIKVNQKDMPELKADAGSGYIKTSWTGTEIKNEMGTVTVSKKNEGISWGALYWQYFEQLDKITTSETPLKLSKQLLLEKATPAGPVIIPVDDHTILKPGDLIKVRIELRVDRPMEYVHMKDMRASAFEPINVLSEYKYQNRLGYYESTRDAATNFFFSYLPKGTYVFEYPLRVTHQGDFSNGVTTIQSMYAPEFSSHSEGVRVKIGK
jgi:hypothetical protein